MFLDFCFHSTAIISSTIYKESTKAIKLLNSAFSFTKNNLTRLIDLQNKINILQTLYLQQSDLQINQNQKLPTEHSLLHRINNEA